MEDSLKKMLKSLKMNESTISTVLGGLIVIMIGVLVFNYFSSINQEGQITESSAKVEVTPGEPVLVDENGEKVPQGLPTTYKVKKGDTLWSVAEQFYNSGYNWVDIASENKLANADLIEVDQELTLPKVAVKQVTVASKLDSSAGGASIDNITINSNTYKTQKGDYLWRIAVRAYGDGYQWVKIYEANKDKIGVNPNILEKDVVLDIPRVDNNG